MSKVKKKRRHYCAEYTKFGFIENPTNPSSPLCLLCLKTFSNEAMKPSRLQDHLNKMHPDKKDNNVAYFQDLEKKHNTQPSVAKLFSVASKQDDDGFRASYNISLLIAQKGKPHNIREELILPAIKEVKMLGGLCQSLLVKYGMSEASSMGSAFHGFLTTASACLLTTALLIACYVLSSNTQQLIRQSIFECMFNAVACFLYLSASSYMGFAVNIYLYPRYALVNMYAAYPAMTAVYYIGVVVGILHGVDAYLSYKYHKGYR